MSALRDARAPWPLGKRCMWKRRGAGVLKERAGLSAASEIIVRFPAGALPTFLFICVLVMCGILGCGSPAFAASSDRVNTWFASQGRAVVVAQAGQTFPALTAKDRQEVAIGTPTNVMGIADSAGSVGTVQKSTYWVASVSKRDGELLGVVAADFASDSAKNTIVIADVELAKSVREQAQGARPPDSLIYDQGTKAWYTVEKSQVSAAGAEATTLIAGAVPLPDFLAQRARNLGLVDATSEKTMSQAPENPMQSGSGTSTSAGVISPVSTVIVALIIIALLTVSLLWLRWEAHHPQGRRVLPAGEKQLSSDTGSLSIVEADARSAARLDKASGTVRVFRHDLDAAVKTPPAYGHGQGATDSTQAVNVSAPVAAEQVSSSGVQSQHIVHTEEE